MSKQQSAESVIGGAILFVVIATLVIGGAIIIFAGIVFVIPVAIAAVLAIAYFNRPDRTEQKLQKEVDRLETSIKTLGSGKVGALIDTHLSQDSPIREELSEWAWQQYESLGPERPPKLDSIEGARYRDWLNQSKQMQHTTAHALGVTIGVIADAVPKSEGSLSVPLRSVVNLPQLVQQVAEEMDQQTGMPQLRRTLDRNLKNAGVMPKDYTKDDIVEVYLKGTPMMQLFNLPVPFGIPDNRLLEHWHLVGGSGHGKTQTIQWFINSKIEELNNGECSIVVIDSQTPLFKRLLECSAIDDDRYVIIDAEDVEYPVCLNLFDINQERIDQYSQLDRERLMNSAIEMYDFVIGSLLGAELTAKQGTAFRYVTRLLLEIPDSTINTMVDLFRDGGVDRYAHFIGKLPKTAQTFFHEEFANRSFNDTRRQVLRRLYDLLGNATFERMFSNPRNKLDLVKEMNAGKLIVVHPSVDLLKKDGSATMGRFFLAMIMQAAYERGEHGKPTYVIVDEAHEYFDQNVVTILEQARKYKVGFMAAHQYLGQLSGPLQAAFAANTSIKMAGGVSAQDARVFASQMRTSPELIQDQKTGHFATYIRGMDSAAMVRIPFFELENHEKRDAFSIDVMKDLSRKEYAVAATQRIDPEIPEPEPIEEDQPTPEPEATQETPEQPVELEPGVELLPPPKPRKRKRKPSKFGPGDEAADY